MVAGETVVSDRPWFEVKGRTFFANSVSAPRPYFGLGLYRSTSRIRDRSGPHKRQFGWRYLNVPGRAAIVEVPVWLYWWIQLWRARDNAMEALVMSGVWFMPRDGGYYHEGHFTWRIWGSFAHVRNGYGRLRGHRFWRSQYPDPINRWERFGWWLESLAKDWDARMPRWT